MKMPSGIEFKHHYYLKQYYKPIFELQLVLLKKIRDFGFTIPKF